MNYLVGDIGNTLTKICLVKNSKILKNIILKQKIIIKIIFINFLFLF